MESEDGEDGLDLDDFFSALTVGSSSFDCTYNTNRKTIRGPDVSSHHRSANTTSVRSRAFSCSCSYSFHHRPVLNITYLVYIAKESRRIDTEKANKVQWTDRDELQSHTRSRLQL